MGLIDDTYSDFIPEPWESHPESNIRKWIRGHEKFFERLDEELLTVIASHQVDHAQGTDLNEVGAIFGDLGKRRGRGDAVYRRYLKSIVQSYTGNGTVDGICFAIASAILREENEVNIEEHYEELEYSITLTDWADHEIGTLWHLANLADPSVVQMRDLTYKHGTANVEIEPSEATDVTTITHGGDAVIEINTGESKADMDRDRGLGSDTLDGKGELGE